MAALADLGVVSAARMIACGECSSRELIVELLKSAESARDLNAFISLDAQQAIAEADAADRRLSAGAPLGRLDGVPVTFKDNIDVVGLPTTAGSSLLRQHYPRRDAKVVDVLRASGVIVFGKTGMHEFAFGATSNNAAFGAIHNPYVQPTSVCQSYIMRRVSSSLISLGRSATI
ncbi:amidase family protein [Methylocapsa sp. S129]|uniref:amidase family protein n=1 Tax=Methylocapsa sp. S129 TaxID=1641869 RepID=UPI00131E388E|nr:amidase family protein [Methylocapsa sp. S129]